MIRFNCSHRGFSLAEAMVCLGLLGLTLGLFGGIMQRMSNLNRFIDNKDQIISSALAGLDRITRDARASIAWTCPAVADASLQSSLEFDVPDYGQDSTRLPTPDSGVATQTWDPVQVKVHLRYRVDQQSLGREAQVAGPYQKIVLCSRVDGLSAQRVGIQQMCVTLSFVLDGRAQTVQQTFQLPNPNTWRVP